MRRPLVIYDLATAPFWSLEYEENFVSFFISDSPLTILDKHDSPSGHPLPHFHVSGPTFSRTRSGLNRLRSGLAGLFGKLLESVTAIYRFLGLFPTYGIVNHGGPDVNNCRCPIQKLKKTGLLTIASGKQIEVIVNVYLPLWKYFF